MNVTDNYLFQQMQAMTASMSGATQAGSGKDKTAERGSFQDMMDQAGKTTSKEQPSTTKDTDSKESIKDKTKDKAEAEQPEKAPVKTGEKEELKPEQLTANPNAVSILDLFRPEVVQPVEEPVIEVPVDAIAEESVSSAGMELEGQMPEMETGVEADVDTGVSMEQQPERFQETMQEVPQEQPVETAQTVEITEAASTQEQVENTDKPQVEEAPEVQVQTETGDEPKAEAAGSQQPVFHDVKSTPVKVGETYETVDTEKPDVEQQLADTIQAAVQAGAQKVEIRLAPQNLGSLTIEMTKDANGALQVVLHASNTKAAGVLNQHLDGLHMALRAYSQEEVRIEVQRGGESQEQHFKQADPDGRGQQQNHRQQQERREEEHTGDAFMQKLRLGLFSTDAI